MNRATKRSAFGGFTGLVAGVSAMSLLFLAVETMSAAPDTSRTVYFVGNATSNFAIDHTSWWMKMGTYLSDGSGNPMAWSGTVEFDFGELTCRTIIFNPQTNKQNIEKGSHVKLVLEYPKGGPWTWMWLDPMLYRGGGSGEVKFLARASSTTTFYRFDYGDDKTATKLGTADSAGNQTGFSWPIVLDANQALLMEVKHSWKPRVTYTDGWITASDDMFLFTKMHHTCTGKVVANDNAANKPGFVIASGTMNYIGDSFQNIALPTGGIVTRTSNAMALLGLVAGSASLSYYQKYKESGDPCGAGSPAKGCYKFFQRLQTFGLSFSTAQDNFNIDNGWTRSAFAPAHMQSLNVVINGGNPI